MSTRDRDPPDERVLDALVDAADRSAEHDVQSHELPSFASIVARAHRVDPATISADDIDYASGVHRVVPRPWDDGVPEEGENDDELGLFVEAAREEAEADTHAWEQGGLPPLSRPASPRMRKAVSLVGALAIAAGLVLAIGWLQSWSASVQDRDREVDQALAGVDTQSELHEATQMMDAEPDKATSSKRRVAKSEGPVPAPESAFVVPSELAPLEHVPPPVVAPVLPPAVPARVAGTVASASPHRSHPSRHPPKGALAKVEAKAHAAVAAGDLDAADRLYGEVIDRGGRSALVELAYADRFTIARRRGDVEERRALWRAYLDKFPRGRFADDARAGLCRVEAASAKESCWAEYVEDFPAGAYRSHAERWLPRP